MNAIRNTLPSVGKYMAEETVPSKTDNCIDMLVLRLILWYLYSMIFYINKLLEF